MADLGVWARVQVPVRLAHVRSMPDPDISRLDKNRPRGRRMQSESFFLIIGVADCSVANDLATKANLYAKAGIRDYWVVNISGWKVFVHRDSDGSAFQSVVSHEGDQTIASLAFATAWLEIATMFELFEPLKVEEAQQAVRYSTPPSFLHSQSRIFTSPRSFRSPASVFFPLNTYCPCSVFSSS